jgi:mycothiol system anti-sigma-R factor
VITCKEAVDQLWAYLDRNLARLGEAELEQHLGLCRHCCGELEFAKQLRELLRRSASSGETPDEARTRLEAFLRDLGGER